MSLEKRLMDLSHKHPLGSATLTVLEHQQVVNDYSAPPEIVADYLQYKYATHKPLGFLLWYVDIHKPTEALQYHHRAQENKVLRMQGGCAHPDPHKFP